MLFQGMMIQWYIDKHKINNALLKTFMHLNEAL